jgi:hypothetical protein
MSLESTVCICDTGVVVKLTAAAMCEHGGITGRGILLDYADWAATNNISVSALESETIALEHIKRVVQDHKLEFRKGDILFIRSGFTAAYNKLNDQQRQDLALRSSPDFSGVEASEGMVRWLWDRQFSAVAGDAPSFERAPIRGAHADPNYNLHEWVLAGWGTPIGEMFNLEKLSEHCKAVGRYSFFLSSMPLKVCISPNYFYSRLLIVSYRLLEALPVHRTLLLFSERLTLYCSNTIERNLFPSSVPGVLSF